jgi:hypothetical protein
MRSALLRGREHLTLAAIATVAEGPAAIALSIGGAPKVYAHTDPNEDGALFATGEAGTLLAVADGHGGADASEIALRHLAAHHAPALTAAGPEIAPRWPDLARETLLDLNDAILQRADRRASGTARTTFALALARPAEGLLAYAAMGDSHIFRVEDGRALEIAPPPGRKAFLGFDDETVASLARKSVVGTAPLAGARAVALVTDGLSERGIGVGDPAGAVADAIAEAVRLAPELRAGGAARGITERALAAHVRQRSGDNVGCAVLVLA